MDYHQAFNGNVVLMPDSAKSRLKKYRRLLLYYICLILQLFDVEQHHRVTAVSPTSYFLCFLSRIPGLHHGHMEYPEMLKNGLTVRCNEQSALLSHSSMFCCFGGAEANLRLHT